MRESTDRQTVPDCRCRRNIPIGTDFRSERMRTHPLIVKCAIDFADVCQATAPPSDRSAAQSQPVQACANSGGFTAMGSGLAIGSPMKRRALSPMKS